MSACSLNDKTWNRSLWFALTVLELVGQIQRQSSEHTDLSLSSSWERRQVLSHELSDWSRESDLIADSGDQL